jgi:hypothetical protein
MIALMMVGAFLALMLWGSGYASRMKDEEEEKQS